MAEVSSLTRAPPLAASREQAIIGGLAAADDLELLRAWRDGDAAAGSTLFDRHLPSVSRFFRNKIDGDVEDLVQETFLACVRGRDSFEQRSSFRTYLFGIAHNLLRRHYERRRGSKVDGLTTSVADLGCSAGSVLARAQEHELLLRALRHLPMEFQTTLELFYWEELDGRALAEVLDIAPGTVRSRVTRARQMLREKITELAARPEVREATLAGLERLAKDAASQTAAGPH